MDNIRELERAWFKYKAKKVMVGISGFLLVGVLVGGVYYAYIQSQSNMKLLSVKKAEMKSIQASSKSNEPVLVKEVATTNAVPPKKVKSVVVNDTSKVSLEPVIPIVDIEHEEHQSTHKKARRASHHISKNPTKLVQAKASTYLTAKELVAANEEFDTTKHKKINLNVTSKNYMKIIKEKFVKTKEPREALLLAKAYYAKANYKEAEHWALVANTLKSDSDESWFVFAKSKAKLGHRDEAIKILISYYKKTNSPKVKELIEKIKKGSF